MAKNKFWTGFFTVLVIIVIVLTAGWFWGREKVNDLVEAYYKKNNITVTYDSRTLTGYPVAFKLLMEKPKFEIKDKEMGITLTGHSDSELFQSYLWNPFKIYTTSRNLTLNLPLPIPVAKGAEAPVFFVKIAETSGSMSLDTAGEVSDFTFDINDLTGGMKAENKGVAIETITGFSKTTKNTDTEADGSFAIKMAQIKLLDLLPDMPEIVIDQIDFQGEVDAIKDEKSPTKFSESTVVAKIVIDWMPAKAELDFDMHLKMKGTEPIPEKGDAHLKLYDFDKLLDEKFGSKAYAMQVAMLKAGLSQFKHKDGYYALDVEFKDGNMHVPALGLNIPLSGPETTSGPDTTA